MEVNVEMCSRESMSHMYRLESTQRDPAGSSETAWYCLQAKHKHEHIAAAHLRKLKGVSVFCPRLRFRRQTRTGVAWVTEALFPGYLFANFDLGRMQRVVGYAHGVRSIVSFANRYPTIDEVTVAQLSQHVGEREIKVIDYEPLRGDSVKVAEGAFAGLDAVVTQTLPARDRVRVLMEFLGRKIETELERSAVLRNEARRESN
jgi:transcriptional antiterminator RfaH